MKKKKMLKDIAIVIGFTVSLIAFDLIVNDSNISKLIGIKPTQIDKQPKVETKRYKDGVLTVNGGRVSKDLLIYLMHQMANSLVVAEDDKRWGFKEFNKTNIDSVYNTAIELDNNDKDKKMLLSIAERWENHDFSKIVEDHNLVCSMFGEDVGKAKEANMPAVAKALESLK